jgi:hypothetical protein
MQAFLQTWCLGRQLISENLQISMNQIRMSKNDIKIKAFAMKSKPDILIVQGESVGGHEHARESREKQNLGEKMGSRNARNVKK